VNGSMGSESEKGGGGRGKHRLRLITRGCSPKCAKRKKTAPPPGDTQNYLELSEEESRRGERSIGIRREDLT